MKLHEVVKISSEIVVVVHVDPLRTFPDTTEDHLPSFLLLRVRLLWGRNSGRGRRGGARDEKRRQRQSLLLHHALQSRALLASFAVLRGRPRNEANSCYICTFSFCFSVAMAPIALLSLRRSSTSTARERGKEREIDRCKTSKCICFRKLHVMRQLTGCADGSKEAF